MTHPAHLRQIRVQVAELPPLAVSITEAARALGVSPQTLRNMITAGRCPVRTVKFGRRRLVPVADLEEFLAGAGPHRGRPRRT